MYHSLGGERNEPGSERVSGCDESSTEKAHEPGPRGVTVVVGSDVEAKPAATVLHVLLEGAALRRRLGLVVEPEDELIVRQGLRVEIVPVCGGGEVEVAARSGCCVEGDGLMREVDVIALDGLRVEGEHVPGRRLGVRLNLGLDLRLRWAGKCCAGKQQHECAKKLHRPAAQRIEL
jgi:hypothetical protein